MNSDLLGWVLMNVALTRGPSLAERARERLSSLRYVVMSCTFPVQQAQLVFCLLCQLSAQRIFGQRIKKMSYLLG